MLHISTTGNTLTSVSEQKVGICDTHRLERILASIVQILNLSKRHINEPATSLSAIEL
jgi:hypothetical protein